MPVLCVLCPPPAGGDDTLIRRWEPLQLTSSSAPLELHTSSVRVLAAGATDCLVSGDAAGELAVWSLPVSGAPVAVELQSCCA